jgi:NitT/TauT family transport system substrate-binding protein
MKHTLMALIATIGIVSTVVVAPAAADDPPSFTLAWSEYPSWSAFGVAHSHKIINGKEGKLGPVEKKWGVDIVLKEAEYDPCLVMYATKRCDAVCITNMDALNPSLSQPSVAILPTSTSHGADALIVAGDITDVKQLMGKKVYGLSKTVSEYCFVRNLEKMGEKEADYKFTNMDPGAAAIAMQQRRKGYEAIVVWNPFVLETLNKRKDARVLFDSTGIPGEIVDMVVMSQSALDKPGGQAFAHAVVETFYRVNQELADAATRDKTLLDLGKKFSNLDLQSMRTVVKQTKFYATPDEAVELFESETLRGVMGTVVEFCSSHDIVPKQPTVGYGSKSSAGNANLRFDPTYIKAVSASMKP